MKIESSFSYPDWAAPQDSLITNSFEGNDPNLLIQDSIVTHAGGGGNLLVINKNGSGNILTTLNIDNSDFIGNGGQGAGIILNTTVQDLNVVDTIFYNLFSVAYALNNYTTGLTAGIEDYCFYKLAPNNLSDQGVTEGIHSIENNGDPLYVDPVGGNFKVQVASLAANLNSTGTPAYAGSQGVEGTTAVENWFLY